MTNAQPDAQPRLFNIPVGRPFFGTLVESLLDGELVPSLNRHSDPLALADTTIFVPTRRAGQALAGIIAKALGPRPVILPRIVPLGDPANLDDRSILADPHGLIRWEMAQAVTPLRRQLELMRLIEQWRKAVRSALMRDDHGNGPLLQPDDLFQVASSPADAFALAGDLASLIDEMIIEGVEWSALEGLVLGHDQYWNITTDFLMIAGAAWPKALEDEGLCEEAARRKSLLLQEAARLVRERPTSPMIVAGSTGSQPATAALMRAIASLDNGAVVLPGLDRHLEEDAWSAIAIDGPDVAQGAGSSQSVLKRLLHARLGVRRQDVIHIGCDTGLSLARAHLVSDALRPAETTDRWAEEMNGTECGERERRIVEALLDIDIIETADEREEALAIAIAMRRSLDLQSGTTALITPDRALAMRVSAELKRFGLEVEDSAGCALSRTQKGALAHLTLAVAETNIDPLALLSLLRHPSATFGLTRAEMDEMIAAFDIGVARNGVVPASMDGLTNAIKDAVALLKNGRVPRPQKRLASVMEERCLKLVDLLDEALRPLTEAMQTPGTSLIDLVMLHIGALEALSLDDCGEPTCFDGEDGRTLCKVFEALREDAVHGTDPDRQPASAERLAAQTYLSLFDALLQAESVYFRSEGHSRLKIYGPLEARLLDSDLVILGGLNEGVWPPVAQSDAFLNRPMRAAIGLSPPERRVGQSAHDFAMALGAPRVILTRAGRVDGSPTVASRFLRRLKACVGEKRWAEAMARGKVFADYARQLDDPGDGATARPAKRPEPRPAADLRPRRLSITEIETLYRDPYAIFAKHVLKLDPLGERFPPPSYGTRGEIIHEALAQFVERHPGELPGDALEILIEMGRETFEPHIHHLDVSTFWWPRFLKNAAWFVVWEQARRLRGVKPFVERSGRLDFTLADDSAFTLSGRADRIDLLSDGSFAVIDYKTGTPPGKKEVLRGLNSQLTLEAAMVKRGAFDGIARGRSVGEVAYVKLSGRDGGKETSITPDIGDLDALCDRHFAMLSRRLLAFQKESQGYLSRRIPKVTTYESPYDHLARVLEWSEASDAAAEGQDS